MNLKKSLTPNNYLLLHCNKKYTPGLGVQL